VSLFATAGAHLTSATLDDKPIGVTSDRERGHPVFTADVELPPRRPVTLAYQLDEPARTGPVIVPVQPLVLPMVVHVSAADC
jgi:hypothetical protein